jgi:phosphoribosylaminoimidazole carboxylase (NCAIR synthetase)
MNYFSSDFKLGILGGGQLGKMLLFDTVNLTYRLMFWTQAMKRLANCL